jgi:enamine deaminase RidA (YjgF/YER057c/UK114 family)
MSNAAARLDELGIDLPPAAKPAANYVGYQISGNQITVSGQVPFENGSLDGQVGKLGADFDVAKGQQVAKVCGINILSQVADAVDGDLSRVRLVRLGVFVNATEEFTDHPAVANGVSDLMVEVLGENGKHARFAVGVSSLPFGVAVEADATFEIIG